MTRKEMKKRARRTLRRHYALLLAVCLIAAFIGAEFTSELVFSKSASEETVTEEGALTNVAGIPQLSMSGAIGQALVGDLDSGREISQEITDTYVQNTKEGKGIAALGRSRGVFASLLNGVDSGAFVVGMISAVRNIGFSRDAVLILFIVIAMGIWFAVWFLVVNIYKAISRRIFLESRIYEKVPLQRFLVFWRVRKWGKVSLTMFMTWLFQFLWCFTIVGGIVKRYSYYLVPYIAAENPDAGWRETIRLSRRMMKGHKWECFVFELSFLLWDLLGMVTLGLAGVFYVNPYKTASFAEYYASLRKQAK